MEKIWRIIDVINWGNDYFCKHNIESPRLLIELLICDVLQIERFELYLNFEKPFKAMELATLNAYVKRAAANEPFQYILGKTPFLDVTIAVNPSVLIPRPETEELASLILTRLQERTDIIDVLDIGTGSGCLAISLAKEFPEKNIYGIDVSIDALKTAKENNEINQTNAKFKIMNILNDIPQKKFDCIVSNPPYIAQNIYENLDKNVLDYEPKVSLTDCSDGLTFYKRFAEIFPNILSADGFFALEYGDNMQNDIAVLFEKNFELEIIKDFANKERFIFGSFKKY
ncbi:MAG: peptide chain release factor N(5)-glutamine methyltransferase [bacterium]